MFIVYDLRVLPSTFDFAVFCCHAYGLALKAKIKNPRFTPIIVTGKSQRRKDFSDTDTEREVSIRVYKLLLPLVHMLPFLEEPLVLSSSCSEISHKLKGKIFFPHDYSFANPVLFKYFKNHMFIPIAKKFDIRMLAVDRECFNYVQDLCTHRLRTSERPIVIAERKNRVTNDPSRDSNYEWLVQTCRQMSKKYNVVFLPDYMSNTTIDGDNILTLREFSDDIMMRAALFEYSLLSILPNGAGGALAQLNKNAKYLMAGLTSGNYFNEKYFDRNGYIKDINPFCEGSLNQIWRWKSLEPEEVYDLVTRVI